MSPVIIWKLSPADWSVTRRRKSSLTRQMRTVTVRFHCRHTMTNEPVWFHKVFVTEKTQNSDKECCAVFDVQDWTAVVSFFLLWLTQPTEHAERDWIVREFVKFVKSKKRFHNLVNITEVEMVSVVKSTYISIQIYVGLLGISIDYIHTCSAQVFLFTSLLYIFCKSIDRGQKNNSNKHG